MPALEPEAVDEGTGSLPPPGALDKRTYLQLQQQLRQVPHALPTFGVIACDLVLIWLALKLLRIDGVTAFLLSQILLAIVFFHSFALLHECGHGSAARSRWLNTIVGHYASLFCLLPYYPWKYIHRQHHAWTGNLERDPVLKLVRTWRGRRVPPLVRWSWRTWIPVGALMQHFVFLSYPITMWRDGASAKLARSACSVAWIVAVYAALAIARPDLLHPKQWLLAFAFFLTAEELVNLPHHLGLPNVYDKLPVWEHHRVTRSCAYPKGVSELFVLNFNFHVEHHLFPALPWHRLRHARALLKPRLGKNYREEVGIRWHLKHRMRDVDDILRHSREHERGV